MSEHMQPEQTPVTPSASPSHHGDITEVEGMSANVQFGVQGVVQIEVDILQGSTYDDSGDFTATESVAGGTAQSMETTELRGFTPYTPGADYYAELAFFQDGQTVPTLLTGVVDSGSVISSGPAVPVHLYGGGQEVQGSVLFGPTALLTLDLTTDGSITRTTTRFSMSGGPQAGVRRANVTRINALGAYVQNGAYALEVRFVNPRNQLAYCGSVPVAQQGANPLVPMSGC